MHIENKKNIKIITFNILCAICHACSQWKWKRQAAISYVEWYYNNWHKANIVILDEAL